MMFQLLALLACLLPCRALAHGLVHQTQTALELLRPQSTCRYEAVRELLPHCRTVQDLDSATRTRYAVELTKCELVESGIEYPSVCDRGNSVQCARALEMKPQWWTSYSGNYQVVAQVCAEHRQQHEAQVIVDHYRNSSLLHEAMVVHLQQALGQLDLRGVYDSRALDTASAVSRALSQMELTMARFLTAMNQSLPALSAQLHQLGRKLEFVDAELGGKLGRVDSQLERVTSNLDNTLLQTVMTAQTMAKLNESAHELGGHHTRLNAQISKSRSSLADMSRMAAETSMSVWNTHSALKSSLMRLWAWLVQCVAVALLVAATWLAFIYRWYSVTTVLAGVLALRYSVLLPLPLVCILFGGYCYRPRVKLAHAKKANLCIY